MSAAERGTTPPELWNMWVRNLETGQIFPATARDVGQGVSKGWILEREVSKRGTMPPDEGLRDHKQLANFFWRHAPVLWADRWTCRCGRWALSRELNSVEQADESRSQHIADAFLEWTAAFAATQRAPALQGALDAADPRKDLAALEELVEECGLSLASGEIRCNFKHVETFDRLNKLRKRLAEMRGAKR